MCAQNQHLELTREELSALTAEMAMDTHGRFELAEYLQVCPQALGEKVTGQQIHDVLNEIDTNHNGKVEVEEYLQVNAAFRINCFQCLALTLTPLERIFPLPYF